MYVENGAIKFNIEALEELIKVKGNSFDQFVAQEYETVKIQYSALQEKT